MDKHLPLEMFIEQADTMERKNSVQKRLDDKGNILIICVVIIMILTSLGIYALNSTTIELTMSGADRRENSNFQNAESGLKFAIANFKIIYENNDRAGNILYRQINSATGIGGLIGFNPAPAPTSSLIGIINPTSPTNIPVANRIPLRDMPLDTAGGVIFTYTENNIPVALIEIRAIQRNPINNTDMTPLANSIPVQPHLSDAPDGFDPALFDGRNYIITSTAINTAGTTTGTTVQTGINIAALKDSVAHLRGL